MVKFGVWLHDNIQNIEKKDLDDLNNDSIKKLFGLTETEIKDYLDKTDTNKIYIGVSYDHYLKGRYLKNRLYMEIYYKKILEKHFNNIDYITDSHVKRVVIRHDNKTYLIHYEGMDIRSINKVNPRTYEGLTNGQILKGKLKMTKKDFSFLKPFVLDYPFFEHEETKEYFLKGDL